jgi:cell division protein FtsN
MEKRKLLLVAVSVGVFLVIVLSAAILIFTPSAGGGMAGGAAAPPVQPGQSSSRQAVDQRGPASADAAEMIRNNGGLQGLLIPPPGAAPSVSGADPAGIPGSPASASAVQENNFYINGQGSVQSSTVEREDPSRVVISVPRPSTPGVPASGAPRPPAEARPASSGQAPAQQNTAAPAAQRTQAASPSPSGSTAQAKPESPPPSRTAAPAAVVPARTPAAPAAAPARTPAAPARTSASSRSTAAARPQRDYWIQTGAFSALVRAEDAKETLASKGLSSIIDDGQVNGQTWYRVRVGPYTSENEANYWLALVRAIGGFDQSQIRSTQR